MIQSALTMTAPRPSAKRGAIFVSLAAGAAVFFLVSFSLVGLGVWADVIPLRLLGPQPIQFRWTMLTIYAVAIFSAAIVAWKIFRVLSVRKRLVR